VALISDELLVFGGESRQDLVGEPCSVDMGESQVGGGHAGRRGGSFKGCGVAGGLLEMQCTCIMALVQGRKHVPTIQPTQSQHQVANWQAFQLKGARVRPRKGAAAAASGSQVVLFAGQALDENEAPFITDELVVMELGKCVNCWEEADLV